MILLVRGKRDLELAKKTAVSGNNKDILKDNSTERKNTRLLFLNANFSYFPTFLYFISYETGQKLTQTGQNIFILL